MESSRNTGELLGVQVEKLELFGPIESAKTK